jgi:hypothetical protein
MAKKQSRQTKTKTKRAPRAERRPTKVGVVPPAPPAPLLEVLTRIIIKKTGTDHPAKVVTFRQGPVVWLIHNISGADHTVTIDPKQFKPSNPLTTQDPLTVRVADRDKAVLIGIIRDAATETAYTYDIEILNTLTRDAVHVDPDLDVVDPRPLTKR